ncbi:hypothetical protein B0T26DRAFT_673528 [Lasiosphaeria miniovina]|uniref:Uncharacterized protein n=1 Tax=Lasiosphaeria miniovina TaxID=1954250 RepID=A0AA40ATH7_9PEZI|nr:uncharacterized protein B0T26DRAFT_673528 [Lasiosphaeria miniovina]KAK0721738.1 hypothetical protein B0T26DRAFT_673528 [Lasiosphaeria miniovina]
MYEVKWDAGRLPGTVEAQAFSYETYKLAFDKADASVNWLFKQQSAPGEQPKVATPADVVGLDQLNKTQAALENARREVADLRWKLFAIWSVNMPLLKMDKDADAIVMTGNQD